MANILLVNADPIPRVLPPLGVSYIAENLKKNGHEPKVIDWGFDKKLNLRNIDIVGISATTLTYFDACKITKKVKKINPKIPVIIGGPHAYLLPKHVMESSGADAVIVGEGEKIMVDIANGKVKPKGIIRTPLIQNLDELPFPTFSYLNIKRYFQFNGTSRDRWTLPHPSIAIMAIRGCPFNCRFCASNKLFGGKIRHRSVNNVIKEIKYLKKTYKIKGIHFYEDTFTLNRQWIKELCKKIKKLNIQWICRTRVDLVDEPLLRSMKNSGCVYIFYGIESGSERILQDVIKKGTTLKQIRKTIKATKKVGLGIVANYMFGIPGETEKDLKATLKLIKELPSDAIALNIFTPLPGSDLAEGLKLDWTKYSLKRDPFYHPLVVHDKKFADLVTRYHRKAAIAFYLSPRYIFSQIKMVKHPKQLYYAFKSLERLLKEIITSSL